MLCRKDRVPLLLDGGALGANRQRISRRGATHIGLGLWGWINTLWQGNDSLVGIVVNDLRKSMSVWGGGVKNQGWRIEVMERIVHFVKRWHHYLRKGYGLGGRENALGFQLLPAMVACRMTAVNGWRRVESTLMAQGAPRTFRNVHLFQQSGAFTRGQWGKALRDIAKWHQ